MDERGYLLPPGDAYTEEMECCFVFVPSKPEYRRAFFGALDYLGTWLAWERDSGKRGADAAQSWKLANELTQECWDMGACDEMIARLDLIASLISSKKCCDGNNYVTYNDNRIITTTISPGVGPDPTVYGETPVADWDEWLEYVCYQAHKYVDSLVNMAEKIDSLIDLGVFVVDALAWLLGVSMFRNDNFTVPIDFTWVGTLFKAVLQGGAGYFDVIVQDIEDSRNDIICAFIGDTSVESAVEGAIGGSVAWTLLYQFLDYESIKAVIYEGGIAGMGYLTPVMRDDCECDPPQPPEEFLLNYHWRSNSDNWTLQGDVIWIDKEATEGGFDIDGILQCSPTPSGRDAISANFSWPGGEPCLASLARSADTDYVAAQNTYIVVRITRVSDDLVMASKGFTHGGGRAIWSLQSECTGLPLAADDYYVTIAFDGGVSGYPRQLDYVSLKLFGT